MRAGLQKRRLQLAAIVLAAALALVACGSHDNGGVIEGPTDTSPNATQGP